MVFVVEVSLLGRDIGQFGQHLHRVVNMLDDLAAHDSVVLLRKQAGLENRSNRAAARLGGFRNNIKAMH